VRVGAQSFVQVESYIVQNRPTVQICTVLKKIGVETDTIRDKGGEDSICLRDDPRPNCTAAAGIGSRAALRSKAHSSQGRHRRVKSPHKWTTEEQFALIVVIISD
jgi:hypothetical protein